MTTTNKWFSHDYHARQDSKIIRLISKFGYEGYGIFWALLEQLSINKGKLELHEKDILPFALNCNEKTLFSIIDFSVEISLLKVSETHIFSERMVKETNKLKKALKQRSEAGKRSAEKRAMQRESNGRSTNAEQPFNENPTDNTTQHKKRKHNTTINTKAKAFGVDEFEIEFKNLEGYYHTKHLSEFYNHWTEPLTKNGKPKFTAEKSFSIKGRIATWENNNFSNIPFHEIEKYKKARNDKKPLNKPESPEEIAVRKAKEQADIDETINFINSFH